MRGRVLILLALVAGVALHGSSALARPVAKPAGAAPSAIAGPSQAPSISDFLAADGSVDMKALRASGYQGRLDLGGLTGGIDASGRVRFNARPATGPPPLIQQWAPLTGVPEGIDPNGHVRALAVYGDLLIVGGDFTYAGGVQVNNIAAWDGVCWFDLNFGVKLFGKYQNAYVNALAVYRGDLYAGGGFDHAGGVPADDIARWDGSAWHAVGSGAQGTSREVYSMMVYGLDLIVGGAFVTAGGVSANGVAAWNWNSQTWRAMGMNLSSVTYVLALAGYNGHLIAGGSFVSTPVSPSDGAAWNVARWNGSSWVPLYQGGCTLTDKGFGVYIDHWDFFNAAFPYVFSLAVYNGGLYVGGTFARAGYVVSGFPITQCYYTNWTQAHDIARWDDATNSFYDVGGGLDGVYDPTVEALTVSHSLLIAGGYFLNAGGSPVHNLAAWDGSTWSPFGSGVHGTVLALAPNFNGDLVVGGALDFINGKKVTNIGHLDWFTGSWKPCNQGSINGPGTALAPISIKINKLGIVIGGLHEETCAQPADGFSVWDGNVFLPVPSGGGGSVHSLARLPGGSGSSDKMVLGRGLSSSGGAPTDYVAEWDTLGFHTMGLGLDGEVNALAIYNGDIIAAGDFSSSGGTGGTPLGRIARWNEASGTWQPLGPVAGGGPGFDGAVLALTSFQGRLIAGGRFTHVNGITAFGVAAWDGISWSALGAGVMNGLGGAGEVHAFAVDTTGTCPSGCNLFVGGNFAAAGGAFANNIARWDGAGFGALGSGMDGEVDALAWYDGTLVAGGQFAHAGGGTGAYLARWMESGPSPFWAALGEGVDGPVAALLPLGPELVVTGSFLHAGGDSLPYLAQWNDSTDFTPVVGVGPPAPALAPTRVQLAIAGANPFVHEAVLTYTLPVTEPVDLAVFDVSGARVASLARGVQVAGAHRVSWNGTDERGARASAGVYFVRLRAGAETVSVPIVRLR